MLTLALDASTYTGSVALLRDGLVIAEATTAMRGEREERLMPAVADLLASHAIGVAEVAAVACGDGPGSFTSLRIAAAIAKGVAAARTLPFFVAPSPLLIVAGADPALAEGRYLAALDAMRGDVFALVVDIGSDGLLGTDGKSVILPRAEAESRARSLGAVLVGPGERLALPPHARGFAILLRQGVARRVDYAGWEPDYGRKAEAQVRWERAQGRTLEVG